MSTIELTASKGYLNVWLECDSQLVLQGFGSTSIVPWNLENKWHNCMTMIQNMRFFVSYIYRECNACVDGPANFGLSLTSLDLFWFSDEPIFIRREYIKNKLGMSNFRCITFWKCFGLVPFFLFCTSFFIYYLIRGYLHLFIKKINNLTTKWHNSTT